MPHPESCQVCIFSQMAKNLQSLPNFFYMLFGPSLTKLNQEGLLHSNCLPANSQSFTNFLLTYKKENAPLPLYSDLALRFNFAIMLTPSLEQGYGKNQRPKSHYIIMMIHSYFNPLATPSCFGAVLFQYALGEVLVCDCLSIGELFMRMVQVVRNPEVDFSRWQP